MANQNSKRRGYRRQQEEPCQPSMYCDPSTIHQNTLRPELPGVASAPVHNTFCPNLSQANHLAMRMDHQQKEMENWNRLHMEQYRFPGPHAMYEAPGLASNGPQLSPEPRAMSPMYTMSPMSFAPYALPGTGPMTVGPAQPGVPREGERFQGLKAGASGNTNKRYTSSTLRGDAPEFVPNAKLQMNEPQRLVPIASSVFIVSSTNQHMRGR
ncbi:hypothetical protein AbraIFM66951_008690 [Aspergillus brasiliensis]|uniref:Uncharacterized protein n=1 Tax=Aspergillus brasiliensis TaxID=319629 RepID=A0A9W5YQC0_9EURO|nr:hypothetical protein AbraCBS73388_006781 [Aspergillus brasiliensis]GKZ41290.1 hypothetical protein AbraIFM66951_008690 [Aspergillus brasiliensis]